MSEKLELSFIVPDGKSAEIARLVESVIKMNGFESYSADGAVLHNPVSVKKYDQERMVTVERMIREGVAKKRDEDLPLYVQYSSDEEKTRYKTEQVIIELSKEGRLDDDF